MAAKQTIEIRDPLHVFVKLRVSELPVLNCAAFQRLRHVHQLALSYLVYPGATHKRFEHSLGVMELATRIFDVVVDPEHLTDDVRDIVPTDPFEKEYWRRVLRVAALCHDTGHLPFSHAAERELLPDGADHEALTAKVIRSDEMLQLWHDMKLDADDIVKLAVEPEDIGVLPPWQAILNEIITGGSFGADRMDYLLRDSLHAGVAYGRFDHFRLIDSLRILPAPPTDGGTRADSSAKGSSASREPQLGIELGGLESAEALVLARYFMFSQVYLHRVRRIYDIHLKDFLQAWLPERKFSLDLDAHLAMTDNEVLTELRAAAGDAGHPGHIHARRILMREHFKVLYAPSPDELAANDDAAEQVFEAAVERFGAEHVRFDRYTKGAGSVEFPVLQRNGKSGSSTSVSGVLARVPEASTQHVFVSRDEFENGRRWRDANLASLVEPRVEEEDDDANETTSHDA
jgi:HD superfamily phosphohydrolase